MSSQSPGSDRSPLVKTVLVAPDPARTLHLLVEEIDRWWPLATHSVGGPDAVSVRVEGRVGGQVVETLADGSTSVWGTVTSWSPPHVVAFTWHPGRGPKEATLVTVRFTPHGTGTVVELTHAGWEARDDSAFARQGYDSGWNPVLASFTDRLS